MSEGPFPRTWAELKPYVTWGSLIFTCGLVFIEKVIERHWGEALAALLLGLGIATVALHSKTWIERTSPNLVFVSAFAAVMAVIFSPFIEDGRWPYSRPVDLTEIAPPPSKPDLRRDFNSEYKLHASQLGMPVKQIEQGETETIYYQAWHENALVTWQGGARQFFCVISADSAHKSFCEDETDMSSSHRYVGNSAEFRAMFKGLPNDKLPPYAGIARRWLQDPTKWSWIGYVDRECEYRGPAYFWELSAGRIIGVFRYKFDVPAGQIISIANDGTHTAKPTINAPECREPRERQSSK